MLTKYQFEYQLIPEMMEYVLQNPQSIEQLANHNYFEIMINKQGGSTFSLADFEIQTLPLRSGKSGVILYTFPRPDNTPEAFFGAIVINMQQHNIALSYFTMELSDDPQRCCVYQNSKNQRFFFGVVPILSKNEFLEYVKTNLDK